MASLLSAFLLGLGSAASPCLLPLYPGFISFLGARASGTERRSITAVLGLAVLAGVLTTMVTVGVLISLLALPLSRLLPWLVPLIDGGLVVLGLVLIAGRNPFARLGATSAPAIGHPVGMAFAYGLFLGPLALPCAGPFLLALLAISIGVVDAVGRIVVFAAYGLGFGVPLVVLSLFAAASGGAIAAFVVGRHAAILRGAGLLMVAAGAWDLVQNAPSLLT